MQETEIWEYKQMLYAQFRIRPGEWDTLFWDFKMQTYHLTSARRPSDSQQQQQQQKWEPAE